MKDTSRKPDKVPAGSAAAGRKPNEKGGEKPVSLKILADYLGLCPATVSVVLNNVPGRSIPAETRERVRAAARKFNYQPSLLARSLRKQRTFTVGVLAPELSDGYHTMVMSGIGDHLMREGYFYLTAHHRHKPDMIEEYPRLLLGRGAEGLIAIDTALEHALPVPVVAVAGHRKIPGVTNVVLDHRRAAELLLRHLQQLGHRQIAFMRGQPFSADSDDRWKNIVSVARELRLEIRPDLTIQLERDLTSPELGYPVVQDLLQKRRAARRESGRAGRRVGDGIRRHSGCGVSQSEADDDSTAVAPHGGNGSAHPARAIAGVQGLPGRICGAAGADYTRNDGAGESAQPTAVESW